MADLDFSHNVSEIPAGQALPQPYHRQEEVKTTTFPDMQDAISNYANSSNWMSFIGSNVAARASTAVAQRIGGELGKDPQGNLGIPLTEFDKTMQESYKTQAQATLGLQANKLITDSNIETAKASRITPDLIQKTNENIAIGLKNIFQHAPADILPHLEYQYGTVAMNQNADLTQRMFREQKEDRKNNTALASQTNSEHAYSFGLKGNDAAAKAVIDSTKRLNDADASSNLQSPAETKSRVDTVRKSYLSGKMIHDYEQARIQGKSEDYLKSIADKKPSYLSDNDYMAVTSNLMTYVNHQDALRSQDQTLRLAKFSTSVAMNPVAPDIAQQLQDLKANVSPDAYEKAQLHYINALKSYNTEQGNVNNALSSWNDPSSFARLTEKSINKGFDVLVNQNMKQHSDQGNPISIEESQVQVAASAGGKIPVFDKMLENKLVSGSPQDIVSASHQMAMLDAMERGSVYSGVSQKGKAIATLFQQQRGSMPDEDLARQITDNLSNVDEKTQKTLDNSWNLVLSSRGAGGIGASKSLYNFALQEVGLNSRHNNLVGGEYFAVVYGNDIYNQLNSNFIATRGDYTAAKKMTQDYVDQHYGDTYVNGERQRTDSPIEKYLGYPGKDITPYVHQDMVNQLNTAFASSKEHNPNDYWETLPLKNGVVEAVRHITTKDGKKDYRYPVNLVGRAGNQWDVVVQTPYGPRNLFLVAPHAGVTSYTPNKEAIIKSYRDNKKKGWFS